jgi:alpha-galactosidase
VFDDSDVIATHSEFVNTSDSVIYVNKLSSLQLDFVGNKADVVSFDGTWGYERYRHKTTLTAGRFEIDAKLGISSANHNPFFMAKLGDKVIGFNLVWSGNHKEVVEISPYDRVRIITGMNDHLFNYKLEVGETLVAPEAIFVCEKAEDELTLQMHKFSLNHIVNPDFAYKPRPALINNWEGTYFNFTGEKILAMAERASKCGIELFVLDDGWFGKRDDDKSGLGDWYDNVKKTGGLKKLADGVKAYGMQFGLWVEPEMICKDSDLYRAHPEFAQEIPGVDPLERRWQLCVDMANPAVCDYLADTLIKLFKEVDVDYVKWDHNRAMSDVYSHALDNQGEYFYKYYVGQYSVLRRIVEACPNVLFESCASGGCRYDLGMQYFMPQNWGSDNTNARDRLYIQEGTLTAYPQSSMGAHVAAHSYCLETKFNVASIGAFGYEFDITKSTKKELATIKKQVEFYKKHRMLLQYGDYYKLGEGVTKSPLGGWITVASDKSEAIAVVFDKREHGSSGHPRFTFKGLDDNALYKVSMRRQSNVCDKMTFEFTAYGDILNNGAIDLENFFWWEDDKKDYPRAFGSRMFYIKKVRSTKK